MTRSSQPLSTCRANGRTMLRPVLAAAALGLAAASATPAAAQWWERPYDDGPREPYLYNRPPPVFRGYERPLPPFAIVERLEHQGYEAVGRPRFNGSVYEIDATAPRGNRVRIVVDAFRGTVVERYALGRAGDGFPGQPRSWFGNNVRPPVEPQERRYSARPLEEDDDTFDRLSRGLDPEPAAPRSRIQAAPLPAAPGPSGRGAAEQKHPAPSARMPAKEASRSEPDLKAEPAAPAGKVEGVNPDAAKPAAAKRASHGSAHNERASKPENNRAFETAHTEPVSGAAKPAEAKQPAVTPEVPAPIVAPQAKAPTPEKPAQTAAATEKPHKPVRVIEGVTPVYPESKDAKTE